MSNSKSILIAGAGIAGPALAILLNNNGFKTTIVERAPDVRRAGQQVDVAGPGIELVRFLGVEEAIKARTVGDEGIKFVDHDNKPYAAFAASSSTASLVREIEILRGDMADVLYQASKDQTEYIFDDRITSLSESSDGITASFKNSPDRKFDLVVAADGLSSRTREVAFGASKDSVVKKLGQWGALFTVPHAPQDGTWSRVYIAPGGRVVCLRPDFKRSQTGVYLAQGSFDVSVASKSVDEQKAYIQRIFQDVGWETKRVLSHMHDAENFYVQQVAQVKMPFLSKGRVVLLGDAGYCPSPVSGLGTTMAYIGAYVLAGCLITHRDDLPEALRQYEKDLQPFVKSAQSLGPGVPGIATPHSEWAVWLTTSAIGAVGSTIKFVQATGIGTLVGWVFWPFSLLLNRVGLLGGVQSMKLPVYESMKGAGGRRWSNV